MDNFNSTGKHGAAKLTQTPLSIQYFAQAALLLLHFSLYESYRIFEWLRVNLIKYMDEQNALIDHNPTCAFSAWTHNSFTD
jgi:hypothetical protein